MPGATGPCREMVAGNGGSRVHQLCAGNICNREIESRPRAQQLSKLQSDAFETPPYGFLKARHYLLWHDCSTDRYCPNRSGRSDIAYPRKTAVDVPVYLSPKRCLTNLCNSGSAFWRTKDSGSSISIS
ncbi:hypothetical protein HDG40_001190 [Paraburkholderia sp. JPY158]|uniref:Uncharacterized protein n=1 Tax=Paraburkholderia atlantica TaxID=2654982 RepID=A0A7W8Q4C4_PARAM|nr:hypothetical protein [Paraburkholderia atlantica]MBB5423048.1 hypothetical protein [Paraburkholderia atlantica]